MKNVCVAGDSSWEEEKPMVFAAVVARDKEM
jgi:hypothetical protein